MSDIAIAPERAAAAAPITPPYNPNNSTNSSTNTSVKSEPFSFTGQGGEFFKIWIVNIILTILTVGIYSAWAKVRTQQYFYGNTWLADTTLNYTAKPLQILKGRMIAAAFFIVYMVLVQASPSLAVGFALILMAIVPWVMVMALRFNAHNTEYRGIKFGFHGGVGAAYKVYLLWPIAAMFSLGILLPMAWRAQSSYVYGNHSYGDEGVGFSGTLKPLYQLWFVLMGVGASFGVLASIVSGVLGETAVLFSVFMGLYFAMLLAMTSVARVGMANYVYNNCAISDHKFAANWRYGSYAKLLLTNTLLIIVTLGLYTPVARIRMARYKAQHTSLKVKGSLNGLGRGEGVRASALGDGVSDVFGIEVAL